MRNKINYITIPVFVICLILGVYFGWIDDTRATNGGSRTWIISLAFIVVGLVDGIVRVLLLMKNSTTTEVEESYIRSVDLKDAIVDTDEEFDETSQKVALIHVDNVADDRIVVKIYKDRVGLVDATAHINKE